MFAHPPSWWPGQWNKAQATSFFNFFRGWDKTRKSRRSSQFLLLRLSSSSTSQWCVWPNHYHHPPPHHWPSSPSSQLSIYDLKSHMSSAWPASLLCFLMNQSMFVALNRNRVSPFLRPLLSSYSDKYPISSIQVISPHSNDVHLGWTGGTGHFGCCPNII